MTAQRLFVPDPPRVDPLRLQSPRYTMRGMSEAGGVLVHFDPAQHVGAVFFLAVECWAIYGPIAFEGFVQSLKDRQIVVPDSDDLATWVAACSELPMIGELN